MKLRLDIGVVIRLQQGESVNVDQYGLGALVYIRFKPISGDYLEEPCSRKRPFIRVQLL